MTIEIQCTPRPTVTHVLTGKKHLTLSTKNPLFCLCIQPINMLLLRIRDALKLGNIITVDSSGTFCLIATDTLASLFSKYVLVSLEAERQSWRVRGRGEKNLSLDSNLQPVYLLCCFILLFLSPGFGTTGLTHLQVIYTIPIAKIP